MDFGYTSMGSPCAQHSRSVENVNDNNEYMPNAMSSGYNSAIAGQLLIYYTFIYWYNFLKKFTKKSFFTNFLFKICCNKL